MFLPFADIYDIASLNIFGFTVYHQDACSLHKSPDFIPMGMSLVADTFPCFDAEVFYQ